MAAMQTPGGRAACGTHPRKMLLCLHLSSLEIRDSLRHAMVDRGLERLSDVVVSGMQIRPTRHSRRRTFPLRVRAHP
jgi:hypothetical protein